MRVELTERHRERERLTESETLKQRPGFKDKKCRKKDRETERQRVCNERCSQRIMS